MSKTVATTICAGVCAFGLVLFIQKDELASLTEESHTVCNSATFTCDVVPGPGSNECLTDEDCL